MTQEVKELTDEQINYLFTFCERHYVSYYDLQVELVDHLANAVTERMSNTPGLDFNTALEEVYKGFGRKGFAPIIASKQEQLAKWSRHQKWILFKQFFTLPKLVYTILMVLAIVVLHHILPAAQLKPVLAGLMALVMVIELTEIARLYIKYGRQYKKLLLTYGVFRTPYFSIILPNLLNVFGLFNMRVTGAGNFQWYGLTGLLIIFFLASLAVQQFRANLFTMAYKQYPQAFRSN